MYLTREYRCNVVDLTACPQGAGGGGACGNVAKAGIVECTLWQCKTFKSSISGVDRIMHQVWLY